MPYASLAATEQILSTAGSRTTSALSRDLFVGRPTEVEPVLGDLVARAEATDTPAPGDEALRALVARGRVVPAARARPTGAAAGARRPVGF